MNLKISAQLEQQIDEELAYHRQAGYEAALRLHDGSWSIPRLKAYGKILYKEVRSVEDISYQAGFMEGVGRLHATHSSMA